MFQIGSTLRESRTRQGLELDDAERATRIRARYLAALEEERFDQLPAEAYAKAFLRTYADFLGLDGALYVTELSSRLESSEPGPPPPPTDRGIRLPRPRLRAAARLGAGAAFVAAGVLAWRFGSTVNEGGAPPSSPGPPTATTTTTAAPAAQPKHERKRAKAHLVLTAARGECWLSVRAGSGEGRGLYEGLLVEGRSLRFAGKRLWVRMGAPWNLEAKLNGKAATLPADTGNVVVTRAGIRPA